MAVISSEHTFAQHIKGSYCRTCLPADVSWNKPFKAKVCSMYDKWMRDNIHEFTKGGNMRRPSFEVFCEWVVSAWSSLHQNLIKNSFRCTGISTATDGSEDKLISCFNSNDYRHGLDLLNHGLQCASHDERTDNEDEIADLFDDME